MDHWTLETQIKEQLEPHEQQFAPDIENAVLIEALADAVMARMERVRRVEVEEAERKRLEDAVGA